MSDESVFSRFRESQIVCFGTLGLRILFFLGFSSVFWTFETSFRSLSFQNFFWMLEKILSVIPSTSLFLSSPFIFERDPSLFSEIRSAEFDFELLFLNFALRFLTEESNLDLRKWSSDLMLLRVLLGSNSFGAFRFRWEESVCSFFFWESLLFQVGAGVKTLRSG